MSFSLTETKHRLFQTLCVIVSTIYVLLLMALLSLWLVIQSLNQNFIENKIQTLISKQYHSSLVWQKIHFFWHGISPVIVLWDVNASVHGKKNLRVSAKQGLLTLSLWRSFVKKKTYFPRGFITPY